MGGFGVTEPPDLRLSIVIPTKDRPQLLAQAVQSALSALPTGAEVLVVDDRSLQTVTGDLYLDPRLRVTAAQGPPGAAGARNWGVRQARGARVLFLDDDDLLLPGYASWILQQRADYGFSVPLSFPGPMNPNLSRFVATSVRPVAEIRPFRRQIAGLGCGFWIDRAAFLALGGISEDLLVNEDTEFSIRVLKAGLSGLRSAAPGVLVRQHGGSGGERGHLTRSARAADRASYFGLILDRHAEWLDTRPDAARFLMQRQLKFLARAGDSAGARAALARPLARRHGLSLRLYLAAEKLGVWARRQ
jgi:GT2 family glycosyltransferase